MEFGGLRHGPGSALAAAVAAHVPLDNGPLRARVQPVAGGVERDARDAPCAAVDAVAIVPARRGRGGGRGVVRDGYDDVRVEGASVNDVDVVVFLRCELSLGNF